jgi:hypothetical protein
VAVRKGPWRLVPRNQRPQVFNLVDDPGETKNVAADHPDVVSELRTVLREARERGRTREEKQRRDPNVKAKGVSVIRASRPC